MIENGEEQLKDLKRLLANVRKYTESEELTAEMLNDLVDKILVYAPDKSDVHRKQKSRFTTMLSASLTCLLPKKTIVSSFTVEPRAQ